MEQVKTSGSRGKAASTVTMSSGHGGGTQQQHSRNNTTTVTHHTTMLQLPALEQSTRGSITYTKNISAIERRIPKSVLAELNGYTTRTLLNTAAANQSASLLSTTACRGVMYNHGFFLTQSTAKKKEEDDGHFNYKQNNLTAPEIRKGGAASSVDIYLKRPKPVVETILGELNTAIKKLRNLRHTGSNLKVRPNYNTNSRDSSFIERERLDSAFLDIVEVERRGGSTILLPSTFERKLGTCLSMPIGGKKKQWIDQSEEMQLNLTSGLNRFNQVMDNVKERERKFEELHCLMRKLEEEEALIEAMKSDGKNSVGALQVEIDFFEAQLEELSTDRISLHAMQRTRKRDLEILQVPYIKDRQVLNDLTTFLDKETEILVNDAKQIDSIRTDLVQTRQERHRVENQSTILARDSQILEKFGSNVERAIEEENERTAFKTDIANHLRVQKYQKIFEDKRAQLEEERIHRVSLEQLQDRFQELASLVPELRSNEHIILHFEDIKKTNVYLKETKECQIKAMEVTRKDIERMQQEIEKMKVDACNVQESDQLQVEFERSQPQHLEKTLAESRSSFAKTKIEVMMGRLSHTHMSLILKEQHIVSLKTDLMKGFSALQEEFKYSQMPKQSPRVTAGGGGYEECLIETSKRVTSQLRCLLELLHAAGLDNQEINRRILAKYEDFQISSRVYALNLSENQDQSLHTLNDSNA